jgi:hypothetical protein
MDTLNLILTATPTSDLPSDWAVYIIVTLLGFIGSIFLALKWLINLGAKKSDSIIKDFKKMHKEGIDEIRGIRDSQIRSEKETEATRKECTEVKYSINSINDSLNNLANKIQTRGV